MPTALHEVYEAATVFPCAFLSPVGSPFGQGFDQVFETSPYEYLDCSDNRYLPPGY